MINALIRSQSQQSIRGLSGVTPVYIEIIVVDMGGGWNELRGGDLFFLNQFHLKVLFSYISDDIILAITDIDIKLLSPDSLLWRFLRLFLRLLDSFSS